MRVAFNLLMFSCLPFSFTGPEPVSGTLVIDRSSSWPSCSCVNQLFLWSLMLIKSFSSIPNRVVDIPMLFLLACRQCPRPFNKKSAHKTIILRQNYLLYTSTSILWTSSLFKHDFIIQPRQQQHSWEPLHGLQNKGASQRFLNVAHTKWMKKNCLKRFFFS